MELQNKYQATFDEPDNASEDFKWTIACQTDVGGDLLL